MNTVRPSRYKVSKIYLSRAINWRKNNSPFLSGDSFADLCDYVAYPPRFRNIGQNFEDLKKAKVIFCPSDRLEEFLSDFKGSINAKVILAGNSDHEFHYRPEFIPRSVKALYLQNSFISDNTHIFTLPIGIENRRLGENGKPRNFQGPDLIGKKINKVLFGPFSNTHPDRLTVQMIFDWSSEWHEYLNHRLPPKNFARLIKNYSYVASVRGNGVDTHRLWESLYHGTVPIIRKDAWSRSLSDLKLPLKFIDTWTMENIKMLLEDQTAQNFVPTKYPALWMDYWKAKFDSHFY